MMERILTLELFCGGGGATAGMIEAGCEVWGVDIDPACGKYYPKQFAHFICDDVFKLASRIELDGGRFLDRRFLLAWASPKCQRFSRMTRIRGEADDHPNQIPATRALLQQLGIPYIIENVPEARDFMRVDVELCGLMFGLDLYKHRIFECSFPVVQPPHVKHDGQQEFSVVGRLVSTKRNGGAALYQKMKQAWPKAMGITHINVNASTSDGHNMFSQAIPPAYSKYLVQQFIAWRNSKI